MTGGASVDLCTLPHPQDGLTNVGQDPLGDGPTRGPKPGGVATAETAETMAGLPAAPQGMLGLWSQRSQAGFPGVPQTERGGLLRVRRAGKKHVHLPHLPRALEV